MLQIHREGVVLIDSSSPQQIDELPGFRRSYEADKQDFARQLQWERLRVWSGWERVAGNCRNTPPPELQRLVGQYDAEMGRPEYVGGEESELIYFETTCKQAARLTNFGNLPLLISEVATGHRSEARQLSDGRCGLIEAMSPKTHPWGTPPWTVDFRPAACPLPEQVDFAIVGGGFTGLSAAAWLRRLAPKKSVLVLEASLLGEGASGRTGGLALAETAAGPLPDLGDVLAGYKKILRTLRIDARLELPGVWELGRSNPAKGSPISWNDSGNLQVVRTVPGGAVDPGKVVAGLARAAEQAGAQVVERAEVRAIEYSSPPRLRVFHKIRAGIQQKEISASQILLATNSFSLELSDLHGATQPKLTLALATAPLTAAQLKAIGLFSRHPFYTVDLPYLWGRLLESNGIVFGAGLVPLPASIASLFTKLDTQSQQFAAPNLYRFDVRKGEAAETFRWLEGRVHQLLPALKSVRITHRWAGPILFTEGMRPIFRRHPRSENVLVLAGYNGHGVALSVYLGQWAAEALLGRRELPPWR